MSLQKAIKIYYYNLHEQEMRFTLKNIIHSFIRSFIQKLVKRVDHTVRSRASFFNFLHYLFTL